MKTLTPIRKPGLPVVSLAARMAASKLIRETTRDRTEMRLYGLQGVAVRAVADSSTLNLTGWASITGHPYDIWGGPADGGWTEYVDRGAFAKTLSEKPDVQLLINHKDLPLARTKSGTLRLSEDVQGLAVDADVDARSARVAELQIAMQRGDVDEMSFAFRVIRDRWLDTEGVEVAWWAPTAVERHIQEVSLQKGDVSVVNYGANDATSADLRSAVGMPLDAAQRRSIVAMLVVVDDDDEEECEDDPAMEDPAAVAADPVVEPPAPVVVTISLAHARALAAR